MYDPPPGFTGTDVFTYTIQDIHGNTESGLVRIEVEDLVWFISNNPADFGGKGNDGRLTNPFQSIADFNGAASPRVGDTIFIFSGSSNYTSGINLQNNQLLFGQGFDLSAELVVGVPGPVTGITLAPFSISLPGASTRPNIVLAGGDNGVDLAQNNRIQAINIGNTPNGFGMAGTNVGTVTVSEVLINGTGGLLDINTGTLAMAFDSLTSTSSVAEGIDLDNVGGGLNVTGATSISGPTTDGINLNSNAGASFTFGSLSITTSNGHGLLANNSGTINIGGVSNTINAMGGAALNVVSTSSGSGWTFASLTSTNSSSEGINLDTITGGTITVTGLTDINNPSTEGIELENSNISFSFQDATVDNQGSTAIFIDNVDGTSVTFGDVNALTPDGASGNCIRVEDSATAVTFASTDLTSCSSSGISLANNTGSFDVTGDGAQGNGGTIATSTVHGLGMSNVQNITLDEVIIDDTGDDGVNGTGVTGFELTNSQVLNAGDGNDEHGLGFFDFGQNNLDGTVLISNTTVSRMSNHGLFIENFSGTLNMTIQSSTFSENLGNFGTTFGDDGVQIVADGTSNITAVIDDSDFFSLESDGVTGLAEGNLGSQLNITVSNSRFTGSAPGTNGSGSGSDNAMSIRSAGNGSLIFDLDGNTTSGQPNDAIVLQSNNSSSYVGLVRNNTIGTGVVDSGSIADTTYGINLFVDDDSVAQVTIDNNDIQHTENAGIRVLANDAGGQTPELDLQLTNNTVGQPDANAMFGFPDFAVEVSSVNAANICADIQLNTLASGAGGLASIRVRQGDPASVFRLERLTPTSGATAGQIQTHLANENTLANGAVAVVNAGFTGVADGTCNAPALTMSRPPNFLGAESLLAQAEAVQSEFVQTHDRTTSTRAETELFVEPQALQIGPTTASAHLVALTTLVEINDQLAMTNEQLMDAQPISNPQSEIRNLKSEMVHPATGHRVGVLASPLRSGETVNVTLGTLNPFQLVTIEFRVTIDDPLVPATTTQVCNQATITATGITAVTDDPDTGAPDDATCTGVPQADLTITKSDSDDPVLINSTYSYVITATNSGPSDAQNVVATDTLPGSLTFASTSGCAEDPNGVPTCSLGTIVNGGSASYTVNVTVPSTGGVVTNVVTVTTTTHDPITSDNNTSEDTTIVAPGNITIVKDATPADGIDFSFTTSSLGPFTLDDAVPDDVDAFTDTVTFANQLPGQYTVTEADPSGDSFELANIVCDDGGSTTPSTVNTGTRTATVNLDQGEDVTCTFSNNPLPGQVIIEKVTLPTGTAGTFDFTDTITTPNSFTLTHGISRTFTAVAFGSYTVAESDSASIGFDLTGLACDDSDSVENVGSRTASINVDPGEIVTCVFTNTARPGTIQIQKITEPSGATELFTFTHNITAPNVFNLTDGVTQVFNNLTVGTYTVTEDDPTLTPGGFDLSGLTCDDANSTGDTGPRTATINLDPDETVTCVFTNSQRGTITIIKSAQPLSPTNFTFSGDFGAFTLDDANPDDADIFTNTISFANQPAGAYTVTENAPGDGYSLSNITCDNGGSATPSTGDTGSRTATINLDPGEDVSCTFNNSLVQPIYLPVIFKDFVAAPDLIVESLTVTSNSVQVTIRNIGNAPVVDAFWVDVYLNPNPVPTGVNQPWPLLASQGLVWGIDGAPALPLASNDTFTLTVGGLFYHDSPTSIVTFPLASGTQVYAQVDSVDFSNPAGYEAVLEIHEITGAAYNNISPLVTVSAVGNSAVRPEPAQAPEVGDRPVGVLPPRK